MAKAPDPQPRTNVLTAGVYSPMKFMQEELIFDVERDSLVRFRGMFIMPNWDGVEDNETDYEVENEWMRCDILAGRYYGDEKLKWVIAARNSLDLPDVQLYKGRKMKIPNKDWVDEVLLPQFKTLVERRRN
jgi:hypothetical protein